MNLIEQWPEHDEGPAEKYLNTYTTAGFNESGGLNDTIAFKVADIIKNISDVPAVAITDKERMLAFIGLDCPKQAAGMPIVMQTTFRVMETGELMVEKGKKKCCCSENNCICPFSSVVVSPLSIRDQIVGTVMLFLTKPGPIPGYVTKLAQNSAQLLSMQIELSEMNYQSQLMTEAKLDALQAQINPHFLFNTINTIIMLIRTDPEMARKLLYKFSLFFRHSLRLKSRFVTLKEELDNVNNYLTLEKARFGDKIKITKKIDKNLIGAYIPILSIQPLVENAIIHGITPKEGNGTIQIIVTSQNENEIKIIVIDDGLGIKSEIMPEIMKRGFGSGSGVGLYNVDERLRMIFGKENGLKVKSEYAKGTTVSFTVPWRME